jgi:hypothetical protein
LRLKLYKICTFFGGTGVYTQDFVLAKQAFYHLGHTSNTFCLGYMCIYFCGIGVWTQGLTLARQVLYYLSNSTSLFCIGYFWDKVLLSFFPGWPRTAIDLSFPSSSDYRHQPLADVNMLSVNMVVVVTILLRIEDCKEAGFRFLPPGRTGPWYLKYQWRCQIAWSQFILLTKIVCSRSVAQDSRRVSIVTFSWILGVRKISLEQYKQQDLHEYVAFLIFKMQQCSFSKVKLSWMFPQYLNNKLRMEWCVGY